MSSTSAACRRSSWRVTLVSVVLSVAITAGFAIALSFPGIGTLVALSIAFAVPTMVAPVISTTLGRTLRALDTAYAELHDLSRTDSLTTVRNHRAFMDDAGALLADRSNEVLLVGMIDIDDFKEVNDRHGHATGDRALQAAADGLRTALSARSVLGRIVGDEFAFALLVDGELDAEATIARVAAACDLAAVLPGLRASLGWTVQTTRGSLEGALAEADRALYRAKRSRLATSDPPIRLAG